jgi:hypothetical protein
MKDKLEQPGYYAVIPASVRYDGRLCANAKLLFAEISALTNKAGFCWAANSYFARLYDVSITSISKWVSQLLAAGHITVEMIYEEGSKEIQCRKISIVKPAGVLNNDLIGIKQKLNTPMKEKLKGGIKQKFKDNNTSSNTTSINKKAMKPAASFDKKEQLVDDFYKPAVDVWFKHHPDWQFEPKDGAGIKAVIKKLKTWQQGGEKEITPQSTAAAFDYVLSHQAVKGNSFLSTADPITLASKMNSIYEQLKAKSNGANHNTTRRSYSDSIFA